MKSSGSYRMPLTTMKDIGDWNRKDSKSRSKMKCSNLPGTFRSYGKIREHMCVKKKTNDGFPERDLRIWGALRIELDFRT